MSLIKAKILNNKKEVRRQSGVDETDAHTLSETEQYNHAVFVDYNSFMIQFKPNNFYSLRIM